MSSEPRTPTGQALAAGLRTLNLPPDPESASWPENDVLAIEAEAVAAYRADLADRIAKIEPHLGRLTDWELGRAAVLRLLTDGAEPPEGAKS